MYIYSSIHEVQNIVHTKPQVLLKQKSQVNVILRMKVIKQHTLFWSKSGTSLFQVGNFLAIFKVVLG